MSSEKIWLLALIAAFLGLISLLIDVNASRLTWALCMGSYALMAWSHIVDFFDWLKYAHRDP